MPYEGASIVDYLKSIGQPNDYASRSTLAASKGITDYSGSAEQNTNLLNMLRGGGGTGPTPQEAQTQQAQIEQTGQPYQQAQTQNASASTSGGNPETAQDLVDMGYYGYTGWGDDEAIADFNATQGAGKGGPSSGGSGDGTSPDFFSQPDIDFSDLFDTLHAESGITELEAQLSAQTQSFNDAQSKINDNPFLSEASRVGRIQKLQIDFNANSQGTRDDIATKKADIETKLNIQMKEFEINSQQASQNLERFQILLSSGALNNATGEDIANITRATGLSSSMIYSMIEANKNKNVQTSVISWDDGENQGFSIINTQTGEIIKTDTVAQSEPSSTGGGTATERREVGLQQTQQNAIADIKAGSPLRDIINHYVVAGGLTVEEVYRLYNANSPYGEAKEDIKDVKEGKFEDEG